MEKSKRALQFGIFLLIFSSIYFLMNLYVLFRFFSIAGIDRIPVIIPALIAVSFPITAIIDRYLHSIPTRILYFLASTTLGSMGVFLSIFAAAEIANLFYPVFDTQVAGLIIISIGALLIIYALINASGIRVKTVKIHGFGKKLRAVQLSDIHIGTIRNTKFLKKVVGMANSQKPDLVFITGDLVDGSGHLDSMSFEALKDLSAPAYFIMGNHEIYEGNEQIKKMLRSTGITILEDKAVSVKGINIIGLAYSDGREYIREALPKIKYDKSKPTILLNHAPVGYDYARKKGVNLQLAGHTHYGQMFPFILLVMLAYKRYRGLHKLGDFYLYISPGTGTWGPPMRIGSRNEITVLEID